MDAIDPDRVDRTTKLAVDLRVGEVLVFRHVSGQEVRLVLEHKHGNRARLMVHAPRSVQITPPG